MRESVKISCGTNALACSFKRLAAVAPKVRSQANRSGPWLLSAAKCGRRSLIRYR